MWERDVVPTRCHIRRERKGMALPSKMSLLFQYQSSPPHPMPRYPPHVDNSIAFLCVYLLRLLLPQWCGVVEGLTVVCVNGYYLTSSFGHSHLVFLTPSDHLAPPPLHLTVLCESSKYVKLRPLPTGLGFHIRGHSPVVIHGIDKGSNAAGGSL